MVMSFLRAGLCLALLLVLGGQLTPNALAEKTLALHAAPPALSAPGDLSPQAWSRVWEQLRQAEALPPLAPEFQTEDFLKIVPGDSLAEDNFGWSIALSGNTLVIGATGDEADP